MIGCSDCMVPAAAVAGVLLRAVQRREKVGVAACYARPICSSRPLRIVSTLSSALTTQWIIVAISSSRSLTKQNMPVGKHHVRAFDERRAGHLGNRRDEFDRIGLDVHESRR